MTRAILVLFLLAVPATSALAQMMCFRPDPPSCARFLMSSSQPWEFDDCRTRLVRFQQEVRTYIDCQRQDRERLVQAVDEAIWRFNACASDRFC